MPIHPPSSQLYRSFQQLYDRFEENAQGTDNQEEKRRSNEHKVHEEQSDGKKLKEQTEAPTLSMNNYETLWIRDDVVLWNIYRLTCCISVGWCWTYVRTMFNMMFKSLGWCLNEHMVFPFLIFLNFVLLLWILVKPNFDQDLNKSKTSKWKT